VKQFSGGMKRRLNIACGLLHRPRIILLDEPTVGVDPQSRDRIYDMLGDLATGGVSLLLTTHHLEEAEARCSRTVIIDHGRVIAAGTLAELVDRTVGRHRLVSLKLDPPPSGRDAAIPGADVDPREPRIVRARMRDVAAELPPLLERVRLAGRLVEDVDVRGPSLQSVFIHLTGRELRE
jgi:ABC-2 type transport system ATP-binding protein